MKDDGFGGEGVDFLRDGFGDEILGMDIDNVPTALPDDVSLAPLDNIELVNEPEKKSDEVKEKDTSQEEEENAGKHCVMSYFKNEMNNILMFGSIPHSRYLGQSTFSHLVIRAGLHITSKSLANVGKIFHWRVMDANYLPAGKYIKTS